MTNQDTEKDQPPSSLLNKIKRFFTIKPSSLDDVSVLLEDALSARLIDKEAQFIAERAIRLGDTTVKAIMVPRVEMVTLAPDEDPMSMINRIIDSGTTLMSLIKSFRLRSSKSLLIIGSRSLASKMP